MSDVNPMLAQSDPRSDKEKVSALFGQSPDVILVAVGEFLKKDPGVLDHHNLRIIAAAAPHIDDPKLVAELIDQLSITKMHVGLRPIDIDATRDRLERVLPHFLPRTRVNLVNDLVRRSTVDVLMFSPPERLTRQAKQFVDDNLMTLVGSVDEDQVRALASEHTTTEVVDAVLDRVEQRIARSERGTTNRLPGKLPLRLVSDQLREIVRRESSRVTAAQLERAWSLVERCEPDSRSMFVLLTNIAANSKLSEPLAHSVLDAAETLAQLPGSDLLYSTNPGAWTRAIMVSVPEISESVARRAVAEGLRHMTVSGEMTVDWRFYLYREHHYDPERSGPEVPRIGSDRTDLNPKEPAGDEPIKHLTSVEVDQWLATRPTADLVKESILAMTDRESLLALGRRDELPLWMLRAMRENPHTPKEVFAGLFAKPPRLLRRIPGASRIAARIAARIAGATDRPTFEYESSSTSHPTPRQKAIADHRLSDYELAAIIRDNPLQPQLLTGVVGNPSAGPAVLRVLLERIPLDDRHGLVVRFALNTGNREVHRLLERHVLAMEAGTAGQTNREKTLSFTGQVRQALADNGTVTDMLFDGALRRHPHTARLYPPHHIAHCYGPEDVARRMIDDRIASGAHLDLMIQMATEAVPFDVAAAADARRALTLLADADMLPADVWNALTTSADAHVVMQFATHRNCTIGSTAAETLADRHVRETVEALDAGSQLPRGRVRSWEELPNRKDVRFEMLSAIELIDGQTVAGLKLELMRTPRQLEEAARYMGNCLEGYEKSVSEGRVAIATAEHGPDDRIAIAFNVVSPGNTPLLEVGEINSRFNRSNVPKGLRQEVEKLTSKLSRGELRSPSGKTTLEPEAVAVEAEPARHVAPSVEPDRSSSVEPAPVLAERPQPDGRRVVRRRRLELNPVTAERGDPPHDRPSLLTNRSSETEPQPTDPAVELDRLSSDGQIDDQPSTDEPTMEI